MAIFDNFEEDKNETMQHPEQHPEQPAEQQTASQQETHVEPPVNEYWVRNQNGYGQGWQQPYPPQNGQNPYGGYQGGYPPPQQYRPPQYQYGPNTGWQQPPTRPPENYQWNFQDYEKATAAKPKKKRNRGFVVFMVSLVGVLAVGLIAISAYGISNYLSENDFSFDGLRESASESSEAAANGNDTQLEIVSKPQISESLPVGGKMTVPQVAKAVSPSVVGVIQYRPDMFLEETGEGSGIIMSADGYIITNAHVVEGGTAFKIILADGTPKDADLVGSDPYTDLAVLKIADVTDLTPAVFGDSASIEVGELVVAIGNPGGKALAGSVTQGIVSAVNREIPSASAAGHANMLFIQTDAAINPGNSGGALVNEYGQVIGINSAKIVAEGFEGVGFAIPISEAKPIVDDIVLNGRVTGRVKLGISAREIDEIDARNFGLQMGIRIEAIDPDSDLAKKDVQRFDIITHIDGERVYTMSDLKGILNTHKPGDRVTLSLFRPVGTTRSETLEATVVLMEDK